MNKKSRPILIAGNWKMNQGPSETRIFFSELKKDFPKLNPQVHGLLFPPALSIAVAKESVQGMPVAIGSQNTHWEKSGAFTGEISGQMLQELGIQWSLVAHSERRQYFGESDDTARKRTESLLAQNINVLFCFGETRAEREAGQTFEVLERQITSAISGKTADYLIPNHTRPRLVLAYEPVWAIGTGLTATPAQAEEAHSFVRKLLWDRYGMENSSHALILYGGSVKPDNLKELLACPNIDGALVGGASLKASDFSKMLNIANT